MSWECLTFKKIGDDVSGDFASNASGMPDVNRFGPANADFSDNMNFYNLDQTKFDANWVTSNSSLFRGNPTNDDIDFDSLIELTNSAIVFDLWSQGIFPGVTWSLRFELNLSTIVNGVVGGDVFIGLTDTDHLVGSGTAGQSSMGLDILQNNAFKQWNTASRLGSIAVGGGTGVAIPAILPTGTPMYWEIKRTDSGSTEVTRFTDADYTLSLGKIKQSSIAGIVNLRYIKIINRSDTTNSGQIVGTIDDVQFFDDTEGIGGFLIPGQVHSSEELVTHGDEDLDPSILFNPGVATKTITGADDGNWSVGGGPSVTGGVVSGWGADATWRRATYDMLGNDGITLDNINWTIDFEFVRTDNDDNPSHSPFMLVSQSYNSDPTNNLVPFPQNGVVMHYGLNGVNGHKLSLFYRKQVSGDFGSGGSLISPDSESIPMAQNVTFYIRMMRIDGTKYVLEVYSDAERTILFGSITLIAPDATLADVTWINSSTNTTGGGLRILNGTVADITIYNGVSGQFVGGNVLNEDFSTYGDPVQADFTDVFNSATDWITTDFTRARVEEDQGFMFFMAERDNTNDTIALDLGGSILGTPTFEDDFTTYTNQGQADAVWVPVNTTIQVNFTTDVIDWDFTRQPSNTNKGVAHDLGAGAVSETQWTLRFTLETVNFTQIGASASAGWVGLFDVDETNDSSVAQNFIVLEIRNDVPGLKQEIKMQSSDGSIAPESGTFDVQFTNQWIVGTPFYYELVRESATDYRLSVYTDSLYTVLLETNLFTGITAGISGLRYLRVLGFKFIAQAQTWDGTIDKVQFWNGIVPSSAISDTNWLLRFKLSNQVFVANASPKYIFAGLSNKDETAGTGTTGVIQNYIGAWFRAFTTPAQTIKSIWAINENVDNANTGNNMVTPYDEGVLWVEISRNLQDVNFKLYDDARYSNLIEESTETIAGTLDGLRYLKFSNLQNAVAGGGSNDATIDDIEFWNDRSTSCDPVETPPSFFDDFSTYTSQGEADTAWVPQVSNQRVNITTDVLDYVTRRDGTDNRCTHDLGAGNVSDTAWILRWKYHVDPVILTSSVGSATLLQIQDTDVAQNSQNDMLGFGLQNNVGVAGLRWLLIGKNGGGTSGLDDSGNSSVPLTADDYYLELVRLDAINVRARVFLNSNFTNLAFELNIVTSVSNINLRYLIISSASDATGWNGTLTGFIDDVQFWNSQTAPSNNWVTNDPVLWDVDPCQENLQWRFEGDGTLTDVIYFDLGAQLDNSKWVMRFKQNIEQLENPNVVGIAMYIGIGDDTLDRVAMNANSNFIGMLWTVDASAGDTRYQSHVWALGATSTGTNFNSDIVPIANQTTYWEIVRESDTLIRISVFSDPNYTYLIHSDSQTISASITGLRYVKLMQGSQISTNFAIGQYDDIKVWDGVDVADSFDGRPYLQFLAHSEPGLAGSLDRANTRYNLDNETNYAYRSNFNGGGDSQSQNTTQLRIQGGAIAVDTKRFYDASIYNPNFFEKFQQSHENDGRGTSAGVAPDRSENVGKWANTITKVSRISLSNDPGQVWGTDTEAVVFGSDE